MPIDPGPVKMPHFELDTPIEPLEGAMPHDPIMFSARILEEDGRTLYLTMSVSVFARTLKSFSAYAAKHGIST